MASATVLAPDFDTALASYRQALGAHAGPVETLEPVLARHLGLDELAGARMAWLSTGGPAGGHRRGWGIVAAFAVTQTVGYGVLYYAFAVLLQPMARAART